MWVVKLDDLLADPRLPSPGRERLHNIKKKQRNYVKYFVFQRNFIKYLIFENNYKIAHFI